MSFFLEKNYNKNSSQREGQKEGRLFTQGEEVILQGEITR